MNKLVRISATVASSLALVAGFSGIAGASSIDGSGRDSNNEISAKNIVKTHVDNDTDVNATNTTEQNANSGNADVNCNDDVAGVSTGPASNDNSTDGSVTVSSMTAGPSGGSGMGDWTAPDASISDSGRNSNNEIKWTNVVSTKVSNDTDVSLTNTTSQNANSGNANVSNNDDVGNVSTGAASNSNSSSFTVSVSNETH